MANFSSFFPAAGGGGGFTKMNKYSTFRATDDATHKQGPDLSGNTNQNKTTGATTMQFAGGSMGSSSTNSFTNVTDSMSGYTFTHNSTEHTITANPAFTYGYDVVFTFTPALTANLNYNTSISFTPPTLTVNPATDLGLSDGDSLGYMLVGAGNSNNASTEKGGAGGNILQGTTIISNASTNLLITPGSVTGTNSAGPASTITGGLTLTSADGMPGGWGAFGTSTRAASAWSGVNGYSLGGGQHNEGGAGGVIASNGDGFGWGSYNSGVRAADGAILLFY